MLDLKIIKAEIGTSDETTLMEWQARIEELSMAVWQVFDKNRTYLSEQDITVDIKKTTTQNRGRK